MIQAEFLVPTLAAGGRAALEELAPGCIAYFPLNMRAPESMQPAKAYWFIEVISRAQVIDWERTETVPRIVRAPDGRESRTVAGSPDGVQRQLGRTACAAPAANEPHAAMTTGCQHTMADAP